MGNRLSRSQPRPEPTFTNLNSPAVGVPVASGVVAAPPTTSPSYHRMAAESVALRVSAEKGALAHGTEHSTLAMLSIKAPAPLSEVKRPAIDLVACIDRSGSMRGDKMRLMKQTLELLVKRAGLKGEDRVSLVSFDSGVKLELPLTRMDADGRGAAESVVRGLNPGATTNLSGGVLKAIDVFDTSATPEALLVAHPGNAEQRTRAVMLFTDGIANEGIRDTPALVAAVSGALGTAADKVGGPISLFTFGFGADHNESCLRALSTVSGTSGLYYYVASAEDIPNAFADCLGGLTSVVAQNATLSLAPVGGVRVARVLGSMYKRDADGAIVLGDLYAEDEKDVLVELTLPAIPTPVDSQAVLSSTLRAFNVGRAAPDAVEVSLSLARPATTPEQPANEALDAQRNRLVAAEAMELATKMADNGDLLGGRQALNAAKQQIGSSSSAGHALSQTLQNNLDELEVNYRSASSYHAVGSKMSKMHARGHMVQRSTHCNADAYAGGAKRKMALKAAWKANMNQQADGSDSD